jgi:hypothetical protein
VQKDIMARQWAKEPYEEDKNLLEGSLRGHSILSKRTATENPSHFTKIHT